MAKIDEFLKKLQQMEPSKLQALLLAATSGLSPADQMKLKKMLSDPAVLRKITDADLSSLEKNMTSPEALQSFLRSSETQKRINEIL